MTKKKLNNERQFEDDSSEFLRDTLSEQLSLDRLFLGHIDHQIDVAKFFITVSSTGIFAAIGLNENVVDKSALLVISIPVLIAFVTFLFLLLNIRHKHMATLIDVYEARYGAIWAIYKALSSKFSRGSDAKNKNTKQAR